MRNSPQVIIFDFDYTLADSSNGIIDCVHFALTKLGLPVVKNDAVRKTIGLSLEEAFVLLAGKENEVFYRQFISFFMSRADEIMVESTIMFKEVPAVVQCLRAKDIRLGIVSQKYRKRIEAILRRENLKESFSVIVGGEDVSIHKPDPSGLILALEKLDVLPLNALYVGDSVTDAETAKCANVPFVAVLSGVTPRESFRDFPTISIMPSISELIELFCD